MPVLSVIAGPNGSGKTTLIQTLVQGGVGLGEYLNADDIARDLVGTPAGIAAEAQQIVRDRRAATLLARHDPAQKGWPSTPVWWLEILKRIKPDNPFADGPLGRNLP